MTAKKASKKGTKDSSTEEVKKVKSLKRDVKQAIAYGAATKIVEDMKSRGFEEDEIKAHFKKVVSCAYNGPIPLVDDNLGSE
jgi:hypothetical protein